MVQADLFTAPSRPERPAASRAAAVSVGIAGLTIRQSVEALYRSGWQGTADDAAKRLGLQWAQVRPRVTELLNAGVLEETGRLRDNERTGKANKVFRVKRCAE
jgi:predicted ArsR family transcriptional regulator